VANDVGNATRRRVGARGWWIIGVLVAIVAADQLTKSWAVSSLADGPQNLIGHTVRFELARNSGSAFSRFQGYTPILAVLAIGIAFFIARAVHRTTDRWVMVALVLVLGGALGNLADRFARSPGFLRGNVVDFVGVGWFPLFNVADSCITIGATILIVRTVFPPKESDRSPDSSELRES
jgi:signal peptidase II